jgi:hypothetical protein
MRTIPLALIAFAALSLSTTGARAADGSWCANYGTGHSGINCTYTSQQQCLASVSGVYGFCTLNPYPGTGYGTGGSWNLTPTARSRAYRADLSAGEGGRPAVKGKAQRHPLRLRSARPRSHQS